MLANHSGENHDAGKTANDDKAVKVIEEIHVFYTKNWQKNQQHQQAILRVQVLNSVKSCEQYDDPKHCK